MRFFWRDQTALQWCRSAHLVSTAPEVLCYDNETRLTFIQVAERRHYVAIVSGYAAPCRVGSPGSAERCARSIASATFSKPVARSGIWWSCHEGRPGGCLARAALAHNAALTRRGLNNHAAESMALT